jgi:hypothetical protein
LILDNLEHLLAPAGTSLLPPTLLRQAVVVSLSNHQDKLSSPLPELALMVRQAHHDGLSKGERRGGDSPLPSQSLP